ncbi:hypothetical protein [Sorangium sp. So ce1099]
MNRNTPAVQAPLPLYRRLWESHSDALDWSLGEPEPRAPLCAEVA